MAKRKTKETREDSAAPKPLTLSQDRLLKAVQAHPLTFATGPAGTGKTYLCAAEAARALRSGQAQALCLTRPNVEAGRPLGFLPGGLQEKYAPYLQPFHAVLEERMGKGFVAGAVKAGTLRPLPLGFMRGTTFRDCWVILDEAQNTTPAEMKMFLTRIGGNCKVMVTGDLDQQDIPGLSGLEDAARRLRGVQGVAHVEFGVEDVVRSDLVGRILRAYAG